MRRYSSDLTKRCDKCNKQFSSVELNTIKVIQTDNKLHDYDYVQMCVCDDCLDGDFQQCYHDEQHYNKANMIELENHNSYYDVNDQVYCVYCYNKYVRKCVNCSDCIDTQAETTKYFDGDWYCQDCYDQEITTCDACGNEIRRDYEYYTYDRSGYQIFVCQDCVSDYQQQCQNCGETINIYNDQCQRTHNGDIICQSCYQNSYFYCEGCNDVYCLQDQFGGSNDYGYYCQECWLQHGGRQVRHKDQVDPQQENQRVQYDYNTKIKPKLKKRMMQQQTKQFIGVQLQLQNQNDSTQETTLFIEQVSKNRKLICKQDGSLGDSTGVEINTFPCTYNFHLRSFGWQKVFNVINQYNMTDITNCGLHFHISKDNFTVDQQKGLDYFVNNCTSTLGSIGGRDYSNNTYCTAVPNKTQWGYNKQRHQAVNFKNSNTIELRFPKSTSQYNIFKKRLRMVHNICKLVKLFSFEDLKTADEQNLSYLFTQIIKEM